MSPAARTDHDLLAAHVAGDRSAFAELVHRHADRLWAVALRVLDDREEAADAVQEALLAAHRAAGRFRGDSAVSSWLHRIVVNTCRSRLRYRRVRRTLPLPSGGLPETGDDHPQARATDRIAVTNALAQLPVEQRLAVVLVDVQGYSPAEAAAILTVPTGTVKSRCARGRARLAALLGHLADDPPAAAGAAGSRRQP